MNVHFPQSEEARSEAENLMNCENMYRSAKDGFPLGGLMQENLKKNLIGLKCDTQT